MESSRPPTLPVVPACIIEARAKQVIHIFLGGGLSHVDSFDYKPDLEKFHGSEMSKSVGMTDVFSGKVGRLHQSHYAFKRRGQSGLWVSTCSPRSRKWPTS